jgi:hypothetical protein
MFMLSRSSPSSESGAGVLSSSGSEDARRMTRERLGAVRLARAEETSRGGDGVATVTLLEEFDDSAVAFNQRKDTSRALTSHSSQSISLRLRPSFLVLTSETGLYTSE